MEICIENMVVDEGDEMILPMSVEYRNDITEDDLIVLCRLCGNCSNQLMPIFTGDGAEHRLPEKIEEHLPIIKVSRDDLLPLNICYQCASTLISWHELYHACKEADQRLRDICLKLQLRAEKSDDTFVEVQDHFAENDALDSSEENNDFDKRSKNLEVNHSPSDSHSVMDPATSCAVTEKTTDIGSEDVDVTKTSVENDRLEKCSNKSEFAFKADFVTAKFCSGSSKKPSTLIRCDSSTFCADNVHSAVITSKADEFLVDVSELKTEILSGTASSNSGNAGHLVSSSPTPPPSSSSHDVSFSTIEGVTPERYFELLYAAEGGTRPDPSSGSQVMIRTSAFECNACEKFFSNKKAMRTHVKVAHVNFAFGNHESAARLKKTLVNEHSDLQPAYVTYVDDIRFFQCDDCDYKCRGAQQFVRHGRRHLNKNPTCGHCGKTFSNKGLLTRHVTLVHLRIKRFRCDVCDKQFGERRHMEDHKNLHDETPKFMCEICGKMFRQRQAVVIHKQRHRGQKTYRCEYCEKAFTFRSKQLNHMKEHTDASLPMCTICGKTFTNNSYLKMHSIKHSNEKPFSCDVCSKSVKTKGSLKHHKLTLHSVKNNHEQPH